MIAAPLAGTQPRADAPTIECECKNVFVAVDLSQATEITADCRACGAKYVVDRSGAGEELPCRCGAAITVPSAILIQAAKHPVSTLAPNQTPLEKESEPALDEFGDVDIEAIDEAEFASDLSDAAPSPVDQTAVGLSDEFDEVNFGHAELGDVELGDVELGDVELGDVDEAEFTGEFDDSPQAGFDDHPSQPMLSRGLPIVAAPVIVQIQMPTMPDDELVADDDPVVTVNDVVSNVNLPIVAIPEVYSIHFPAVVAEGESLTEPSPLQITDEQITDEQITDEQITDEHVADGQVAAEIETSADDSSEGSITIACPGCRREYPATKDEMGQTAECECGFVFVMQENIAALDSALCADLMPFVPLTVDRTGARRNFEAKQDDPVRSAGPPPSPRRAMVAREVDTQQRTAIIRILTAAAAGFLITTIAIGVVVRNRGGGVSRMEPAITKSEKVAIPISANRLPPGPVTVASESAQAAMRRDVVPDAGDATTARRHDDSMEIEHVEAVSAETPASDPPGSLSEFLQPLQVMATELESTTTLDRDPLFRFGELQTKIALTDVQFTVRDLFWLGNLWEGFGLRAENPELASKCYWMAASVFGLAQTVDSITPSDRELAIRRQRELSAKSHSVVRLAVKPVEAPRESASR
ncbi:MAG: hypothetical protein KDB00_03150 [Planctomycetales bacterium]|nr:hypothetical protein [Planctomycetales bacterium]